MPSARPQLSRRAVAGAVLVVLGVILCLAYRFSASGEEHSYSADEVAPYSVALTAGHTYHLSIHNGVAAEADRGLEPSALSCTIAADSIEAEPLTVTAEQAASKATNVIATFVAPASGRAHVACTGLSAVFVDDADDASPDRSGAYLLLGVIALAVGVPLALSALRSATRRRDGTDDAPSDDTPVADDEVGSGAELD